MELKEKLQSLLVVFFILFIFASGLPYALRKVLHLPDVSIFPWQQWAMFYNGSPWVVKTIAEGKTTTGEVVPVDIFRFAPRTTYLELEGNRLGHGISLYFSNHAHPQAFCEWLFTKYNNAGGDNVTPLYELDLSSGVWMIPPDFRKEPLHKEPIVHCGVDT